MAYTVALPSLTEQTFCNYLSTNYAGSYPIYQAYNVNNIPVASFILVYCGDLVEIEPYTGLYKGNINISIWTQIDDNGTEANTIHDATAQIVYAMMNDNNLLSAVNGGDSFHLWSIQNLRQTHGQVQDEDSRQLRFDMEFEINCQLLAL